MKKLRFRAFFLFLVLIANSTCKREFVEFTMPEGINPVTKSGSVATAYTDLTNVTIQAGVFATAKPKKNGDFTITLNDSVTQLVCATINGEHLFLMNIVAEPSSNNKLELNANTTARSLIFLSPAAIVSDPVLSEKVLGLIDKLPQTNTLAALIDAKLKSDPEVFSKDDYEIKAALEAAINAFVSRIDELSMNSKEENTTIEFIKEFKDKKQLFYAEEGFFDQKAIKFEGLTITPAGTASGLTVNANSTGSNKYSISVTNSRKRFVEIYHENTGGTFINRALLPSRKSLVSFTPLSPSTVNLEHQLNVALFPTSTIQAYGLGAQGVSALTNSQHWQERIVQPVVLTIYMDFFNPLWSVVTGTKSLLGYSSGTGKKVFEAVLSAPDFIPALAVKIQSGDYTGATVTGLKKTVDVLLNNPGWIKSLLQEQGLSYLQTAATLAIFPLKLASLATSFFELGSAVYDFSQSSMYVVFTLSSTDALLPYVTTTSVTQISASTAMSGGNVTSQGGSAILARGVCWNNIQNPLISDYKTIDGSGTGQYISSITGLAANTTYYVRAYATNSAGTAYGQQISFVTPFSPGSAPVAAFTATPTSGTAPLTVNFTDQSSNNPTSWAWEFGDGSTSTYQNPSKTYQNAGNYNVKLTASNAHGTDILTKNSYITVTTGGGGGTGQPCPGTPTVTDIDGNVYNTVLIGNQCWMKENLKTTKYRNNTPIEYPGSNNVAWQHNTSGAYAWYNNDISWKDIYGGIYNGYSVKNADGICPHGWVAPSDSDFQVLVNFLTNQYGWTNTHNDPNGIANKLKSCRQVNSPYGNDCQVDDHPRWDSNSIHFGDNLTGFSALPSMTRGINGLFSSISGAWTNFRSWSDHPVYNTLSTSQITYDRGDIKLVQGLFGKNEGLSIRCLRENSSATGIPCPNTPTVTDVEGNAYNTILIGNQCWMKENLKTTKYRDGSSIEYPGDNNSSWQYNNTGAYSWYNNDISWKNIYGALYNYYAVNNGKQLCPTGWRLPVVDDLVELQSYIGNPQYDGNKLKSCRSTNSPHSYSCNTNDHPRWDYFNQGTNGTDDFGFTAFPAGERSLYGDFSGIGKESRWFISNPDSEYTSYFRVVFTNSNFQIFSTFSNLKNYGLSVRCIKE